jgi:hypothetical protein
MTGITSTTGSLVAAPSVDDLIVVMVAQSSAAALNAPTYGGTTLTLAGSVQVYTTTAKIGLWYGFATSANIAAGGTSLGLSQSVAGGFLGYSVTVLRNVNQVTPLDTTIGQSTQNSGAGGVFYYAQPGATTHTSQGVIAVMGFCPTAAITTTGGTYTTYPAGAGAWVGASTTSADIIAVSAKFTGDQATDTATALYGMSLSGVTASRNYCSVYQAFNPATYTATSQTTSITEGPAASSPSTSSAVTGGTIAGATALTSSGSTSLTASRSASVSITSTQSGGIPQFNLSVATSGLSISTSLSAGYAQLVVLNGDPGTISSPTLSSGSFSVTVAAGTFTSSTTSASITPSN